MPTDGTTILSFFEEALEAPIERENVHVCRLAFLFCKRLPPGFFGLNVWPLCLLCLIGQTVKPKLKARAFVRSRRTKGLSQVLILFLLQHVLRHERKRMNLRGQSFSNGRRKQTFRPHFLFLLCGDVRRFVQKKFDLERKTFANRSCFLVCERLVFRSCPKLLLFLLPHRKLSTK